MSQPERRAVPVLSVMDMVPVSAGCSRTDALTDMIALARAADAAGYERYWLAEHHGSTTYLSSATIVLMGQVLAATERLGVASGGIMLPNHAPLVVAEQIGTLATLYPGRVGLPFAVASHFAPVQAEAAIATYRSVLESRTEDAPGPQGAPDVPRVAAAVNVMVAPSQGEARLLFGTAMAAAARIVGNRPGPLDPPSQDPQAWRAYAPGREDAVEAAMSLSFVGTADDVAARLREQAARWDLDEILVVTYAHDPALRRRSYELLAQAWNA